METFRRREREADWDGAKRAGAIVVPSAVRVSSGLTKRPRRVGKCWSRKIGVRLKRWQCEAGHNTPKTSEGSWSRDGSDVGA